MSAGVQGFESAESELFSIHEKLLEPVLAKLSFVRRRGGNTTTRGTNGDAGRLTLDSEREEAAGICLHIDLPSDFDGVSAAVPSDDTTNVLQESEKHDSSPNGEDAPIVAAESMVIGLESSLDHRCIVNISDIFYCVHIQEIWDAELMLEIRMEDSESLTQFHLVVHEPELMAIATYLFETGIVEENYAPQVTYGLPRCLHTPICKLPKKHLQPLVLEDQVDAEIQSLGAHEKVKRGELSISSLLEILVRKDKLELVRDSTPQRMPSPSSGDDSEPSLLCAVNLSKWRLLRPLGSDLPQAVLDQIAHELELRHQSITNGQHTLQSVRHGCRHNTRCEYVMLQAWSGFESFEGLVLAILVINHASGNKLSAPTSLLAALKPLDEALKILGFPLTHRSTALPSPL